MQADLQCVHSGGFTLLGVLWSYITSQFRIQVLQSLKKNKEADGSKRGILRPNFGQKCDQLPSGEEIGMLLTHFKALKTVWENKHCLKMQTRPDLDGAIRITQILPRHPTGIQLPWDIQRWQYKLYHRKIVFAFQLFGKIWCRSREDCSIIVCWERRRGKKYWEYSTLSGSVAVSGNIDWGKTTAKARKRCQPPPLPRSWPQPTPSTPPHVEQDRQNYFSRHAWWNDAKKF